MTKLAVLFAACLLAAPSAAQSYRFPSTADLPDSAKMPDPFMKPDGARVTSLSEWPRQRAYLRAMMEHYLYGRVPPRPTAEELSFVQTLDESYTPPDSSVEGRKQTYRISITRNSLTHSFHMTLWRPGGDKRYPTLINNAPEHGHASPTYSMEEGVRRGYMLVEYERIEVAPDEKSNADRRAGIFRLYPEYDFYTIAAWGWAYQPVIDALDRLGVIDMGKIIVTGHSRGGQAAMAGGIFDERIAMVAPSTGGPFTVGASRQRDPAGYRGDTDYPAVFGERQPHWYHPRYYELAGRQNKLPWDAPTLAALTAPRPLINLNAVGDGVNNALAHEVGVRAGILIYEWMNAGKWCRLHWRDAENEYGQEGHDQGSEEFNAIYDYADEYFFEKARGPSSYNVGPKSDSWIFDPVRYPLLMDWKAP